MPRQLLRKGIEMRHAHIRRQLERNRCSVRMRNSKPLSLSLVGSLTIYLQNEIEILRDLTSIIAVIFYRFKDDVTQC